MRIFAVLHDHFGEKKKIECTGKTRELFVLQRVYIHTLLVTNKCTKTIYHSITVLIIHIKTS
jgi:hypothetical protein